MSNNEIFPLVDEEGNVTGKATRLECHNGSMLLHPVVHLHVVNENGELYLQKRSIDKDIQPGRWDTSVGGHVDYGETIEDALKREAYGELGLKTVNPVFLFRYVFQSDVEKELVNTFLFKCEGRPVFKYDPVEIDDGRFWAQEDICRNIGKGVFTPNFEQEFIKLRGFLID